MLELQLSDEEVAATGLSAANVDKIKKEYLKLSKKEQTEAARAKDKEMKALEKLVKSLMPKVSVALKKVGVDVKKMDLQVKDLQKKSSPAKIRQIEKLAGNSEVELQKELASAGINESAVVEQLLSIIKPPSDAHVERRGLFTISVTTLNKGSRDMKAFKSRKEK